MYVCNYLSGNKNVCVEAECIYILKTFYFHHAAPYKFTGHNYLISLPHCFFLNLTSFIAYCYFSNRENLWRLLLQFISKILSLILTCHHHMRLIPLLPSMWHLLVHLARWSRGNECHAYSALQSSDFMPMFINVLPSVNISSCCWKVQTEDWNKAIGSRKSVEHFAPCNYYASSGGKGEILCCWQEIQIFHTCLVTFICICI